MTPPRFTPVRTVRRFFRQLRRSSVHRSLLLLATPIMVNNILFTLMGFVDSIMVGQLGEDTISAVGNASQVQVFLFLIFAAIGQGGSILVAQYHGAGDRERLRATAGTMIGSGFFIGAAVGTVTWFFGGSLIWLLTLGRGSAVVAIGGMFLQIVAASYVLMVPGNMVASVLRATGDTKTPVYIGVAANALNILGNWLLIFGIGPFPRLGYQGAAISTLIAQSLQGLALLAVLLLPGRPLHLRLRELARIRREQLGRIIRIGYPMSIDGFYWQAARIAYTMIFNFLGSSAYAAYTIVRNIKGMATLPTAGLQTATMITVGKELGKGRMHSARVKAREGVKLSVSFMALPAIGVILLSPLIVSLFRIAPDTWNAAVVCTMILGASIFFTTVNSVIPGVLRAGGDTAHVMVVTLLCFLLVGGPLTVLFGIVLGWGTIGAFVGVSIEEVVKAFVFARRMRRGDWVRRLA
jgi:putative MATE family efflux protein